MDMIQNFLNDCSDWLKDFEGFATASMATPCLPAPSLDPRQNGWPCHGQHQATREKSNQYATWTSCKKCGLRLSYLTKAKGHGETRSVGPAPEVVLTWNWSSSTRRRR